MSHYEVLFLDADHTLFDTTTAKREAFAQAISGCFTESADDVYEIFGNYHMAQWRSFKPGYHNKADLFAAVFKNLFDFFGLALDERHYSTSYLNLLGKMSQLLDGVERTCRELTRSCRLVVISNEIFPGLTRKRIENSRIAPYISQIISSDEAGMSKPDSAIFSLAMNACHHPPKDKVLMVGDSLAADIVGGARFGLDTCWYNPKHMPPSGSVQPDYTIFSFTELTRIISAPHHQSQSS